MAYVFNSIDTVNLVFGNGMPVRRSVSAATTTPGTLATSFAAGQVIDGFTLSLNNRILIKNQVNAIENGIYVVTAGQPNRAAGMAAGASVLTGIFSIQNGTINGNTMWMCANYLSGAIVGSDSLSFRSVNGGGGQTDNTHVTDTATTAALAANSSIAAITYNPIGGTPPT